MKNFDCYDDQDMSEMMWPVKRHLDPYAVSVVKYLHDVGFYNTSQQDPAWQHEIAEKAYDWVMGAGDDDATRQNS